MQPAWMHQEPYEMGNLSVEYSAINIVSSGYGFYDLFLFLLYITMIASRSSVTPSGSDSLYRIVEKGPLEIQLHPFTRRSRPESHARENLLEYESNKCV